MLVCSIYILIKLYKSELYNNYYICIHLSIYRGGVRGAGAFLLLFLVCVCVVADVVVRA